MNNLKNREITWQRHQKIPERAVEEPPSHGMSADSSDPKPGCGHLNSKIQDERVTLKDSQ